jgi:hypothetical protein
MVWGLQFDARRTDGSCARELTLYRIEITFPEDLKTRPKDPASQLYDPATKTMEMGNIVEGCDLDFMMAFAPDDPVGPHRVSVWLTQLDRSDLGRAYNVGRPPDRTIDYNVYQAPPSEAIPSAFAHCGSLRADDPNVAGCKADLDFSWWVAR